MIKFLKLSALLLGWALAASSHAIEFWHGGTVQVGQGQCSAVFTFDSGAEETSQLQVSVSAVNRAGKTVASGVLAIERFGQAMVDRYADAFLEGEALCAKDLSIVVTKASAVIGGKETDLLAAKALVVRDFRPFRIRLAP